MKIAVIGCGAIANMAHIPSYINNPAVEIKYFCDILPERAEKACETYGCGTAIVDYHDAINDPEIIAISVCTPNKVHPIITKEALQAGKHVLCEKPAARTYDEALSMQQMQHETDQILNIGVVNRFNKTVNKIRDRIQAGDLGEVYHVYVSFRAHRCIPGLGGAFTDHSIAGGGVLIDWGVHYIDIVMYCTDYPKPLTVSGQTYCKLGNPIDQYVFEDMWAGPPVLDGVCDVEEFVTGFVRTEGPTISLNGAWAQNIGKEDRFIDFIGTKGGIRLTYGGGYTYYSTENGKLVQQTVEAEPDQMYQTEIDAFVDCIQTGKKLPAHIDTAIITAKIMQGLYDSAEQNKEVTL